MLFLLLEKLLHSFNKNIKILEVLLFYKENCCICVSKTLSEFVFFVYLVDEIVTRTNL